MRNLVFLPAAQRLADFTLLLMRLFVGLFLVWGVWDNVTGSERMQEFAAFLGHHGFASPRLMAPLSVYLQLAIGICFVLGAFTRWFNSWALLVGWAVGIALGTAMAAATGLTATYPLVVAGFTIPGYTALYTVVVNLVIAVVLTPVFNAVAAARDAADQTVEADYLA